jgi:hypothetical protein
VATDLADLEEALKGDMAILTSLMCRINMMGCRKDQIR